MQEQETPKSKNKKLIFALIILAVIVLAGGGLLASKLLRHPLKKVVEAGKATSQSVKESSWGSFSRNLSKQGSLTIRAKLNEMQDLLASAMDVPIKVDAVGEITCFIKEGGLALKADTQFKGQSLLDMAFLYNEGKDLVFSSKALLGETNYGLDLKNLAQNLNGSIFDPANNGWYRLPSDFYAQLQAFYLSSPGPTLGSLRDQGQEILGVLRDRMVEYLIEHAEFDSEDRSITLGGDSLKPDVLTMRLDEEGLCGLLKEVLRYFREDKAVDAFLDQLNAKCRLFWDAKASDKLLKEEFLKYLAELEEQLPELQKSLKGGSFIFEFYTISGQLVRMDLKAVEESSGTEGFYLCYAIGPDPGEPKQIVMQFRNAEGTNLLVNYVVSARSSKQYSGKLSVSYNREEQISVNIDWNKESGALSLLAELPQGNHALSLKGQLLRKRSLSTLDLEELVITERGTAQEPIPLKGFQLEFNEKAEFPTVSGFTEISLMSEEEFQALMQEIQETLSKLASGIQGSLLSP